MDDEIKPRLLPVAEEMLKDPAVQGYLTEHLSIFSGLEECIAELRRARVLVPEWIFLPDETIVWDDEMRGRCEIELAKRLGSRPDAN